jgi:hypothetical protein
MVSKKEVVEFINGSVSADELIEIYRLAHERFKLVGRHILFNVTDKVRMKPEFQNRRPYGEIGSIMKVNNAKVKVNFGSQGLWNVDKSCLERV